MTAFAEVDVVKKFEDGAIDVAQANGIAGISSNTLMFGWSDKVDRLAAILKVMKRNSLLGNSTVICRVVPRKWSDHNRRIDVWWGGLQNNGDLLLLFAHLLVANPEWRNTKIRINSVASNQMMKDKTSHSLREMLVSSRIEADVDVILKPPDKSVADLI